MKKETLLTIAVLILIVLNVALLVVFNVNQGRPPFAPPLPMRNFPPENTPGPGKVIVERLKLDESQRNEFLKLKQQHLEKVQAIQEKSRTLHDELFDLLKEPQIDTAKEQAIINSLGENRKELEQAIFDHFAAIKQTSRKNCSIILSASWAKLSARLLRKITCRVLRDSRVRLRKDKLAAGDLIG